MEPLNVGVIGTGWCGGIRAITAANSALVGPLHLAEISAQSLNLCLWRRYQHQHGEGAAKPGHTTGFDVAVVLDEDPGKFLYHAGPIIP